MDADIQALSDSLVAEIFKALGLSESGWARRTFGPLFQKATNRLSAIGVTFDRLVAESGFPKAAEWALTNWCTGVTARGAERVPAEGPLLVISNHPGTYDSLVITSRLRRNDIKFIASDIPFLKKLPHAHSHFILLSDDTHNRMAAARAGIRHLQTGGALLLFGTGLIDPDPAIFPDAEKHLERWSPSIDLFLRLVPEANVLITIVSGVLAKRWGYHPITWLRHIDWQKRRISEFGQVLQQLFFPGSLYLSPRLGFAPPVSVAELHHESSSEVVLPAIIRRAKALLAEQMAWAVAPTDA